MTTQPAAETASEETTEPYYTVDLAAVEALGRSAAAVVASRLCEAAREKVGSPEKLRSAKFADLQKLLRQHCKNDPEFLNPKPHPRPYGLWLMAYGFPTGTTCRTRAAARSDRGRSPSRQR